MSRNGRGAPFAARIAALAGIAALMASASLPAVAIAGSPSPDQLARTNNRLIPVYARKALVGAAHHSRSPRLAAPRSVANTSTIAVTYHGFTANAKTAFQAAVNTWQSIMVSSQTIHVDAYWKDLGDPYILGQAGATADYPGGDGYIYPAPLAEARCACQKTTGAEIVAEFNSAFSDWYMPTDGNTPQGKWDFESVVLHELGHGLGFYSSFDVSNFGVGTRSSTPLRFDSNEWDSATGGNQMTSYGNNSTTLRTQLTDGSVFLGGAHVEAVMGRRAKLFAPNPWQPGSSNSHLDEKKYGTGTVNALMTPILYDGESIHSPGAATIAIFQDIGWTVAGASGDTTAPPVEKPSVNLLAGQTMTSAVNVSVSWPVATDDSGIALYELQRQDGAGSWTSVALATPTSTSAEVNVARGSNVGFRVRATDGVGNTGAWAAVPSASMETVQETSSSIAYSAGWTRAALSGAAGGSVEQSSTTDGTATFTFNGTSVALVSTVAAARGIAEITVDGGATTLIDLYAASKHGKRVVWASESSLAPGSHTLVVRVTGSEDDAATSPRVDVDAFLVWP
jgi:hypothetical protein